MKYRHFFRILIVLFLFAGLPLEAQTGYSYRSCQSGEWNSHLTWQYDDGGWKQAPTSPPANALSVLIQSGHTVVVNHDITLDSTIVDGKLTIDPGVTVTAADGGRAPDLLINGILLIKGNLIAGGSVAFHEGSRAICNGSAAQSLAGASYFDLEVNNPEGIDLLSTANVNGTLTVLSGDVRTGSNALTLGAQAMITETTPYCVLGILHTARACSAGQNQDFGGMGVDITLRNYIPLSGKTVKTNTGPPTFLIHATRFTGVASPIQGATAIKRHFQLSTSGSDVSATAVFHYATGELNGTSEPNLQLYRSTDAGSTWSNQGGAVDTSSHTIRIVGMTSLTWWSPGQRTIVPTLSAITPTSAERGSTLNVKLTGMKFISGLSTVACGGSGITVNSVTVISSTQMIANISVGVEATPGPHSIVVANGQTGVARATLGRALTITNPLPTVVGVAPSRASKGDMMDVVLTGTNFISGATGVSFGDGITVNAIAVSSLVQATANITVGSGAAMGSRTVMVTNTGPGGGTAVLASSFLIGNPVPTLVSVSPASAKKGQTVYVTLNGSGFLGGASSVSFGNGAVVKSLTLNGPSQLTATISIGLDVAAGAQDISVTNAAPGGGAATLPGGFVVENPTPTISGISPPGATEGSSLNITLTGTNFIQGVSQVNLGPEIQLNSITVNNSSQMVLNATIALSAMAGSRDVVVTHGAPGGGTATLAGGFAVLHPSPTITSITPTSINVGGMVNASVNGSHFITGVTSVSLGADISVSNLLVKSPTEIQVSLAVSPSAAPGARSITVTNAGPGGGSVSLMSALTIATGPAGEIEAQLGLTPDQYVLQEAYPNPFNPSTRIRYGIPEDSRVKLDVYNMLGNIVSELIDGVRSKGLYELQWHADNLPSGVYLVRLHAESLESTKRFIASRKVVLVK